MSIEVRHTTLSPTAQRWLVAAVDPVNPSADLKNSFPASEATALLRAAELHGVLSLVLRAIRQAGIIDALHQMADGSAAAAVTAVDGAKQLQVHQAGMELLLKYHGFAVLKSLHEAGLPAAIVKGPVFAKRLYAEPALRQFTDIDILIPVAVREQASRIIATHGFVLHPREYRGERDFFEDVWLLDSDRRVSIEVHSNLVHNPKLRQSASVRFEDVAAAGGNDLEDATALLFVAATHGAFSHQFDRLQHLVDVMLAASGAAGEIDASRLWSICRKNGTGRAVYTGLMIAGRLFPNRACEALAKTYEPSLLDRWAARLINPQTILDARSDQRGTASWRRKLLRQAIR